jgi:hypothetical protein
VTYHVTTHAVRPFKDLGPEIHEKCVQGPTPKDHNLCDGVFEEEKSHGATGAKGMSPDVFVVEAEGFLVASISAGVP